MSDCTILDDYNNLKKAYAEVCVERDMLKDKILSIKKIVNIHYGLTEKIGVISSESYEAVCAERDKLKEENTNWKIICNALVNNNDLPTYKGADDFV